jgi:hypothetical protein
MQRKREEQRIVQQQRTERNRAATQRALQQSKRAPTPVDRRQEDRASDSSPSPAESSWCRRS